MSWLEGKDNVLSEWKDKFLPTYAVGLSLWVPAQLLNFLLVPPAYRVIYIAVISFFEINILCFIRKISYDDILDFTARFTKSRSKCYTFRLYIKTA